jgi:hypothetical protein
MIEPVINEFGNTYEKKAYINHATAKKTDPSSGTLLQRNIMYDNISLKAAIEHYLEEYSSVMQEHLGIRFPREPKH